MQDLRDTIALVTGASRGIGPFIAGRLAAEGVRLCLVARSVDELEAVAEKIRRREGADVDVIAADIVTERHRILDHLAQRFGHLDVLVNNAAIFPVGPFTELAEAEIEDTIQTNLLAPMLLTRELLPLLEKGGPGHVVTVSSLGGKQGPLYQSVYAATKGGLIQWMAALRAEYADRNVGFSTICPSFVLKEGMFARYGVEAPRVVGRCTPEEVAEAVVRAVERNQPEVIVGSRAVRLLLAIGSLFPRFGGWFLERFGVNPFLREHMSGPAEDRERVPV